MSYYSTVKPKQTSFSLKDAVATAGELKAHYGQALIDEVTGQYSERLEVNGFHGPHHWERVLVNGLILKQLLPDHVDEHVLFLFALFHDSKRQDEGQDWFHGMRGADYFIELLESGEKIALPPQPPRVSAIYQACSRHTDTLFSKNSYIAACFDADRLDLFRVGIYPDLAKLNYQTAVTDTLIYQSSLRAKKDLYEPIFRESEGG